MKRLFTSTAVGILFVIGANIPCFGHDWTVLAIVLQFTIFLIGYTLMEVYGRNYWKWIKNE